MARLESQTDRVSGKKSNSDGWMKGAFTLTTPSDLVDSIVCIDDCPNCPLYAKECAGKCIRWDEKVCASCPCLGSKYAVRDGVTKTVDPDTNAPKEPDPLHADVHALRLSMRDGELIDPDVILSLRRTHGRD